MEGKHFKRDCRLVILNIFYTISFPFVRKDQAVIGTNILIDLLKLIHVYLDLYTW